MTKFNMAQAGVTAVATAAAMAPAGVARAEYGYGAAAATTVFAGFGIFILFIALLGLAAFILWVVMLIDALQRTNWQDESQKTLWIIILVVSLFVGLHGLAAIIYYFVIRKQSGVGSVQAEEAVVVESKEPAPKVKKTTKKK